MRRFIIIIFLIGFFTAENAHAQDWAPEGAIWYYTHFTMNPDFTAYTTYESVGDTVINGQSCRKILKTDIFPGSPKYYWDFMYSDSNRVYFLDKDLVTWCLLYDFNVMPGDSFVLDCFPITSGPLTVIVDSVDQINVNGNMLGVQYYTGGDGLGYEFNGPVVEGIGNYFSMFPSYDLMYTVDLRCYEDSIIGLYKSQYWHGSGVYTDDCDLITTGLSEPSIDDIEILVYPNPSNGRVYLNAIEQFNKIELFDCFGQLIKTYESQDGIYTNDLGNGLYILSLTKINGSILIKKIIVNGP